MKKYGVFFLAALVLLSFTSCEKKTEVLPPVIEILSPHENTLFKLPEIISVKLHIVSDQDLTVLRISIDNQDEIPLSVPVFLYPDVGQFDFEVEIKMDQLPEGTTNTYLNVSVESNSGLSSKYLQLQFEGPFLISKGFYLITSASLNQTNVQYFDTAFLATAFIELPNEYSDAAVSSIDDMLFISIKTPDKLLAYHHQHAELKWEKEGQMPFPQLYNLNLTDALVYTGTGNGRIWGYRTDNGNEQFISPLVFDSVPGAIGVFADYIVVDYKSLIGPEMGWLVFYKETAVLYQKHSSQLSVHAYYPALQKNHALVFGNIGNLGVIQFYDIENNKVLISLNFATGIITASCQMESGVFLLAIGKDIWQFNEQNQSLDLLHQAEESVVDLDYDIVARRIFVAEKLKLSIYNITGDTLVHEIESSNPIHAVRLRLGYPSLRYE